MNNLTLELLQAFVTFCLLGLIWTIQIVHYPSFSMIDRGQFSHFHQFHSARITWVVAPLMLAELGLAMALLFREWNPYTIFNLCSVIAIWGATFLVSVPLHGRLSPGYNSQVITSLVASNWIRTTIWSVRALVVGGSLIRKFA